MQKKLKIVCSERDNYRQVLDSYEKDLTMSANMTSGGPNAILPVQKERIDNLEKIVENYRDLISKYEIEMQNGTGFVNG